MVWCTEEPNFSCSDIKNWKKICFNAAPSNGRRWVLVMTPILCPFWGREKRMNKYSSSFHVFWGFSFANSKFSSNHSLEKVNWETEFVANFDNKEWIYAKVTPCFKQFELFYWSSGPLFILLKTFPFRQPKIKILRLKQLFWNFENFINKFSKILKN